MAGVCQKGQRTCAGHPGKCPSSWLPQSCSVPTFWSSHGGTTDHCTGLSLRHIMKCHGSNITASPLCLQSCTLIAGASITRSPKYGAILTQAKTLSEFSSGGLRGTPPSLEKLPFKKSDKNYQGFEFLWMNEKFSDNSLKKGTLTFDNLERIKAKKNEISKKWHLYVIVRNTKKFKVNSCKVNIKIWYLGLNCQWKRSLPVQTRFWKKAQESI